MIARNIIALPLKQRRTEKKKKNGQSETEKDISLGKSPLRWSSAKKGLKPSISVGRFV